VPKAPLLSKRLTGVLFFIIKNGGINVKEQLSMVVENQPNVLLRVFRLLARYGLNVDSLSVAATADGSYLEITLTTNGINSSQQFVKMLRKLIEVVEVKLTWRDLVQLQPGQ
jgi:acetolactate synthase small subunit